MGNITSLCCNPRDDEEHTHVVEDNTDYGTCNNSSVIYNVVLPGRVCIKTFAPVVVGLTDPVAFIKKEYCSEQFQRIRTFMIKNPDGEKEFRECVWSCVPWTAPSGKSGSTFFKTLNDLFILKQMTKIELQTFLSISESYFNYVEESYNMKRPSLLSTILGIYRIVYKDVTTNIQTKCDYMVMQNLFYGKNINRKFDLKGSTRNRLVNTDNYDNCVLLDENLLRLTIDKPLRVCAKSKIMLTEAIHYDSEYLQSISVMDYSLLVGIDESSQNIYVGIIDYVRPFTWDKKIEQVIKSVGNTEMPTIVEPSLYRNRFCEAMDKYFECI